MIKKLCSKWGGAQQQHPRLCSGEAAIWPSQFVTTNPQENKTIKWWNRQSLERKWAQWWGKTLGDSFSVSWESGGEKLLHTKPYHAFWSFPKQHSWEKNNWTFQVLNNHLERPQNNPIKSAALLHFISSHMFCYQVKYKSLSTSTLSYIRAAPAVFSVPIISMEYACLLGKLKVIPAVWAFSIPVCFTYSSLLLW